MKTKLLLTILSLTPNLVSASPNHYIQPVLICSESKASIQKASESIRYLVWQQMQGSNTLEGGTIAVGVGPNAKIVDHSITKTESGYVVCETLNP